MKDLIIGAISANYTMEDVRYWSNSIKKSGFDGDVVVFCYNFEKNEIIDWLKNMGFIVVAPNFDNFGQKVDYFEHHSGKAKDADHHKLVHQVRFFHAWAYLNQPEIKNKYRYIIVTDVRDVVFQQNPSEWLNSHDDSDSIIVAPSENVTYESEAWNRNIIIKHFGPHVYEYLLKDKPVCNVGTIAGRANVFIDLCIAIYQTSLGVHPDRLPMPGDQTGFNFLINTVYKTSRGIDGPNSLWSCQCGTMCNPQHKDIQIEETKIEIDDEGIVTNFGKPFYIVHQYDRVPEFHAKIMDRYRELEG